MTRIEENSEWIKRERGAIIRKINSIHKLIVEHNFNLQLEPQWLIEYSCSTAGNHIIISICDSNKCETIFSRSIWCMGTIFDVDYLYGVDINDTKNKVQKINRDLIKCKREIKKYMKLNLSDR